MTHPRILLRDMALGTLALASGVHNIFGKREVELDGGQLWGLNVVRGPSDLQWCTLGLG